jgi:hypothetical protein
LIGVLLVIVLAWFRSRTALRGGSSDGEREGGRTSDSPTVLSCSRLPSIAIGGLIGLLVGAVWTSIIGPFTDGPPSIALSFMVYVLTLTCTGLIVGAVQRLPALVGLGAGVLTLVCAALVVGPNDGWMGLWLIVFGGSGLLCGPIVGGLYYLAHKPRTA